MFSVVDGLSLTRVWAANNFNVGTSNNTGWNNRSRALGRRDGSFIKHFLIKSFCPSSSSDSIHFSIASLETGPPESVLVVISRAAVSRAHIPNAKMSIAGVKVIASSKKEEYVKSLYTLNQSSFKQKSKKKKNTKRFLNQVQFRFSLI